VKSVLHNKNLQLYFAGQTVSLIGTWMQQIALSWLVYGLTNSPFMLGVIGFISQVPSLLLTPFAGIVADRFNRHRLIMITQVLAMIQAALLTALVWTGQTQLWQLMLLSGVLGAISAFDIPTRQSFVVDMLDDKAQVGSAVSISSSITTLTRLVGPFIAGLVIAWAGEKVCFLANALSYLAVIAALSFVKAKPNLTKSTKTSSLSQLKEGIDYTFGFGPIRDLILFIAFVGLFAMPFAILMPAFAKDVFHGNAFTLGSLTGCCGAGSVIGALFLGSRKGTQALSRWLVIGCALCGIALTGLGLSNYLPLSLITATAVGFGSMVVMAGCITLIQTIVDPDKRGRVMSFVVMAFMGLSPFGCIAAGALANIIGPGKTVITSGICTFIVALFFAPRLKLIHLKVTPSNIEAGIAEAESEIAVVST